MGPLKFFSLGFEIIQSIIFLLRICRKAVRVAILYSYWLITEAGGFLLADHILVTFSPSLAT
jgi:hypothetical protein